MSQDLLVEIGTEELPPTALSTLSQHFSRSIQTQLDDLSINYQSVSSFATPRRLAVLIKALDEKQQDKTIERKGPAMSAAFSADGKATKAAEGFARSCQTSVDKLSQVETEKGLCLAYSFLQQGRAIAQIIPEVIQNSLDKLPIAKRMRWGSLDVQFVRPVHWLVVLYGSKIIDCEILSVHSSNITYGHRFHHPEVLKLANASSYESTLLDQGFVIADYEKRKQKIVEQIQLTAKTANGQAVIDPCLLDEVTGMVEWPKAVLGSFDEEFLAVPDEALISSMKNHQKYFHLYPITPESNSTSQQLLPLFITISNIESKNESLVREGNERVIRPRLADAMFFWQKDLNTATEDQLKSLSTVIFQHKLGSIADKTSRLINIAKFLAEKLNINAEDAQRAAHICKADLMSEMVGEFPELQGIMGRYYALAHQEPQDVAIAIDEHYLPRYSGDKVSKNPIAQVVAIADRVDSIYGIFAIGLPPSGDKDPFALRRASLGLLRTIVENKLDIDLRLLLNFTASNYPVDLIDKNNKEQTIQQVLSFIMERFKGYLLDQGFNSHMFEAVNKINISHPVDFILRIKAVQSFSNLPESSSLSAANKRISNILKKSEHKVEKTVNPSLFAIKAENTLYKHLLSLESDLNLAFTHNDFKSYLTTLAQLKNPIDDFFEQVMVFVDDISLRDNRLALLQNISNKFTLIADISYLNQ